MALPGFTADQSVGPTVEPYRVTRPLAGTVHQHLSAQCGDDASGTAEDWADPDEAGSEGDDALEGSADDGDGASDSA